MGRYFLAVFVASLALVLDLMGQGGARANEYDHLVAKHAAAHGVPAELIRRVIQIETRGNPSLVNKGNYGLMQIRLGTARAMGYSGDAGGLLDADTNMTYAVRYLAGAYRAAGGNSEQAIRNYQRGYYEQAKAQGFSPYTLASPPPPQAAAPDPAMLRQQQDIERRKAAEQQRAEQRQAMLTARLEQQKTAEQQRITQRQALLQERIDRQQSLEQQRIAQRQAIEQKRIEQRQAMLQQKLDREQAQQQQRIELEQARQKPPEQAGEQRAASAPLAAPTRRAAAPGYAWYNPMRYFKHPSHQANPLPRER